MRQILIALIVLLSVPSAAFASDVFAGWRYVTEAVGARDADAIAYIVQSDARTTLYTASGPDYSSKVLAASAPNDGVPIEAVSISGDGRWIAYGRGGVGDAAGRGEISARGAWVVGASAVPCRLGEGARPTLSPRGDQVSWLSKGRLMRSRLSEDCAGMQTQVSEMVGGGAIAPVWSPDGTSLAFEQPIGRSRRIGVWRDGQVRYIDHGGQLDVAPAWSPDGRSLAFLRIDPSSDAVANQYDEDPPARFSVMTTPVDTLSPTTVWSSPGEDGFARQWRSRTTPPVAWLDSGRLIFLSEHQDWQHVYALDLATRSVRDLTPGACETDYLDVAPNGSVYVSDNCSGVDRRRISRIDTHSGTADALTGAQGVAVQPFVFNHGERVIWRGSLGPVQTVQISTPRGVVSPEPPPANPFADVKMTSRTLLAADEVAANAQVYAPTTPGPHPEIILLHGGPQRQTFSDAAPSAFYSRFGWMNRALAAKGYVVLQLNYRSGNGQGRAFRRIRGVARGGAGEFKDLQAAQIYLASRKDVDRAHIGVWGDSWGGWLTALGLARRSDLFASGVVVSGVYDLSKTSFGPLLNPQARSLAKASSAAGSIDAWRSPVLIVHGMGDNTVPYSQATSMYEALKARGRPAELVTFPREAHALQLEQDWTMLYDKASAFFDRTLAGKTVSADPDGR